MSKATENSPIAGIDATALQGILAAMGQAPAANPKLNRLFDLLSDKIEGEHFAEEETKERKLAARKAGAQAMQNARNNELLKQNACPHQKPDRESALAGQRNHQGQYMFICQICGKEWLGSSVPNELRISVDKVGGPNY